MPRISLPSNASLNYFPNNTPSSYRVKMPDLLKSSNKYECALSEIIFPNQFKNVRKGLNIIKVKDKGKIKEYTIPTGNYLKIKDLVYKIKNTVDDNFVIFYDQRGKRTMVKTDHRIQFGPDIARLLGFSGNTWIGGEGGNRIKIPIMQPFMVA